MTKLSRSTSEDVDTQRKRNKKRKSTSDADPHAGDDVLESMVTAWVNGGSILESATKMSGSRLSHKSAHGSPDKADNSPAQPAYSVHITQIAFTASEMEIRKHFFDQGVAIKDLRMVYDKGVKGKQFRGVAFIDLADEESYKKSLKLNKTKFQGRKINVRPTRSKEELTDIVAATNRKVAEKIKKYKEEKAKEDGVQNKAEKGNRDAARRRIENRQRKRQRK